MQPAFLNCQTNTYRRREPEKEVLYQAIAGSGLFGESCGRQVSVQDEVSLVGRHILHHSIWSRIAGEAFVDSAS
jgi:hypothetical protein